MGSGDKFCSLPERQCEIPKGAIVYKLNQLNSHPALKSQLSLYMQFADELFEYV